MLVDTRQWQIWLNSRLPTNPLAVDGVWGPKTAAKTAEWQRWAGVPKTGVVDAPTLEAAMQLGFRVMPKIRADRAQEILARAISATGRKTRYVLGAGGYDPVSETPYDRTRACDCTGFVAWCWGMDRRFVRNKIVEVQSDALVIEAQRNGPVQRVQSVQPGCVLVYPGLWTGRPLASTRIRPGHAAVFVGNDEIIDCSSSTYRSKGDAITKRDGRWMLNRKDVVAICLKKDLEWV